MRKAKTCCWCFNIGAPADLMLSAVRGARRGRDHHAKKRWASNPCAGETSRRSCSARLPDCSRGGVLSPATRASSPAHRVLRVGAPILAITACSRRHGLDGQCGDAASSPLPWRLSAGAATTSACAIARDTMVVMAIWRPRGRSHAGYRPAQAAKDKILQRRAHLMMHRRIICPN